MLPNFGYGCQIMPTDVKKQGLPQMSANRPNIGSTGIIDWNFHDFFFVENNKKKSYVTIFIEKSSAFMKITLLSYYFLMILLRRCGREKNFQKTQ